MTTLRKEDIVAVVKTLVDLKDGKGEIDDIDNLGNRRVRSVGELLENQYRVGLLRMERAVKERMSSVDVSTVMPNDLINAKPAVAAVREFFGSSQLSQFMDQTNPLSEVTHKRRVSALGPGGLTRERAGFEVRDVHPTHYGRICPIETPEGPNIGLINSLASFSRVNKYGFIETPYRKVVDHKVTNDVVYLSAMEEAKHTIAQANAELNEDRTFGEEIVSSRRAGEFLMAPRDQITLMDVSPKQLVSVAASLIPFLENDDANRALMGSNMQRQAVPLIRAEAPFVGTGMEETVARDSGAAIAARRSGIVDQVDATRIVVRATGDVEAGKSGVDIYTLMKFQRSNQNTCINQRPLVKVGDVVNAGDVIADGPSTELGELALGRNVLVAFMPWNGYNFEDSILISERIVKDDVFTSIHIEEFEVMARDTKLGPEDITRDIPNVGEEALRNLDEAGIVYIGAEVEPGDILCGKITPKGESPMTPEEKLLRAIFGEKASDVRDTSLRLPPGVSGTVVEVRVFNRHGIDIDDRTPRDPDRGEGSPAQGRRGRARHPEALHLCAPARDAARPDRHRGAQGRQEGRDDRRGRRWTASSRTNGGSSRSRTTSVQADLEAVRAQYDEAEGGDQAPARGPHREARARRRAAAGRAQDGQGVRRGEAQAAAGRQDGRPSRQQGRDQPHPAERGHAVPRGRDAGRHRAQSAGRAEPDERRPDLRDPSGLGRARPRQADRGRCSRTSTPRARASTARTSGRSAPSSRTFTARITHAEIDARDDDEVHGARLQSGRRRADGHAGVRRRPRSRRLGDAGRWRGSTSRARSTLFDGRTGEAFDRKVTVGYIYMLKLHHLVDDKIHARSIGPYSLVTQQPLGGKAQFGGQRFGEMEVWALQAYGAAYTLQEMLTVKSDDVIGRTKVYEAIVKGDDTFEAGIPESFNVLVKEMRSLGLNVELNSIVDGDDEASRRRRNKGAGGDAPPPSPARKNFP